MPDMRSAQAGPIDVPARLRLVRQEIALATEAAGRTRPVKLVAVTKTVPVRVLEEALDAGQRIFGENRVQEAHAKWPALKEQYPNIELHLVGPLQSNKVRDAVTLFDVIETVDRPKIARTLAEEMARSNKLLRLLAQVNTGDEPQKAGIAPGEAVDFVTLCRDTYGLAVEGLMCIPPFGEEPAMHFALLAKLAEKLELKELSMGMSGDFARAIQFGATYVRVGAAIFGERLACHDDE